MQFSQWMRNSNRAAPYRQLFEDVDKLMDCDKPFAELRIKLIEIITRHASELHHENEK